MAVNSKQPIPSVSSVSGRRDSSSKGSKQQAKDKQQGNNWGSDHIKTMTAAEQHHVDVAASGVLPAGMGSTANAAPASEWGNMALLVLLYMMQGVPMGLTMGAMPFMLQSRLSYAQMGVFSLAAYPYSFKLLWSPVVDSVFLGSIGRRKSWIIPIQLLMAGLLWGCADYIHTLFTAADVNALTAIFLLFVLLAATQDIAVDGWALTLLSPARVGYASTCQTLGTSTGYFTSFTVFLALQDPAFCNTYVRPLPLLQHTLGVVPHSTAPLVTLPGYLRGWGVFFAVVTLALWVLKPEGANFSQEELQHRPPADPLQPSGLKGSLYEVRAAYRALWGVVKLPAVWLLAALLLTYRLGVLVAEGAVSLKLMDQGVPKEALATLPLLQFPVELASALVAGRWAAGTSPARPFLSGYWLRLGVNAATVALVAAYPGGPLTGQWWMVLAALAVFSSWVSTLCFTALGSFFNSISDPDMGGAYLTLLNTIANCGVILPKAPAFWLIDMLTQVTCRAPPGGVSIAEALACPRKPQELAGASECTGAGGQCVLVRDGFFWVSWASLAVGAVLGLVYLRHVPALMRLPLHRWRAQPEAQTGGSTVSRARSMRSKARKD